MYTRWASKKHIFQYAIIQDKIKLVSNSFIFRQGAAPSDWSKHVIAFPKANMLNFTEPKASCEQL